MNVLGKAAKTVLRRNQGAGDIVDVMNKLSGSTSEPRDFLFTVSDQKKHSSRWKEW